MRQLDSRWEPAHQQEWPAYVLKHESYEKSRGGITQDCQVFCSYKKQTFESVATIRHHQDNLCVNKRKKKKLFLSQVSIPHSLLPLQAKWVTLLWLTHKQECIISLPVTHSLIHPCWQECLERQYRITLSLKFTTSTKTGITDQP